MYIHYIAINSEHPGNYFVNKTNGLIDYVFLHIKSPCTFIIDNKTYNITPPCVVLINRNTPHKYFPTGMTYCDDYLHFSPDMNSGLVEKLTFPLNFPFMISKNSSIGSILEMIATENKPEKKYSDSITTLLIELLFIKVTEEWELHQSNEQGNPHYKNLLAVHSYIRFHPERSFTIEQLSAMAHLSPAYFQVLYKRTFGITCINDVIECKLSQAKILLSSTNHSVQDIAAMLGYNEVYHFIRQFKKNTGLTPLSFRKQCELE